MQTFEGPQGPASGFSSDILTLHELQLSYKYPGRVFLAVPSSRLRTKGLNIISPTHVKYH